MTPLERVTAALEARGHPVRNGTARCPAHDDTTPSLSVSEGADGKALVKCHAGCDGRQIVEALNLTFADLFPAREADSVVVARYPYIDADGNVVVTVVRTHPKGFYREPKGITNVPLYNLLAVNKAIREGDDIWIVEGEKDVHTMARHGETATCNIGGAGKFGLMNAFALDQAETVYIVADRDDAGRAHAKAIYDDLEGVIPHLSIWEPATGKDITDHFAAGLTIHDLMPFQSDRNSDENGTETEQPLNDGPINWAEFWSHDHPDEEWIIEPLIPRGRGVSLYAPAKEGKSTILLAACAAAATGTPIFGQPPQPARRCMYADYEMTRADLQARLTELGYGPHTDLTNLTYWVIPPWAPLDTVEGGVMITAAAIQYQAEVVFIDTIGRAVAGDEDKADTLRAFYRCTGQALKREGIAWLRADHSGKDPTKGARGTSAKNDDIDIQWSFKRGDGSITIKRTHTRISWAPEMITLERKEDDNGVVTYELTKDRGYGPGTKDLADTLDGLGVDSDATVKRCREALKKAGLGAPNTTLADAVRWRKSPRNVPRNDFWAQNGTSHGTKTESAPDQGGTDYGTPRNESVDKTERPYPYKRYGGPSPDPDPTTKELF